MICKRLAIIGMLLLAAVPVAAQRVGLTLSGGGAKGLYHIGVIRALEENDIPIDYISGTSMGSIVAGLYAAGYTPDEMVELAASGAVGKWLEGKPGIEYEALYRRRPDNAAWVTLRLNVDENKAQFSLPSNLISSSQIDLAMNQLFAPADAASGYDFDSLMVPFRCVSADMAARRPVTISGGRLGEAIRSSMSIPLVFRPLQIDSMLLYDGGIFNNFPWQPLDSEFCPDILIGSICTSGNIQPDADGSILDQASLLMMNKTDYSMPEGRSIVVERSVPVGMLDFDRAVEIIAMGYADALERMPCIKELIPARRSASEMAARRKAFRSRAPELVFDSYCITGLSPDQQAYVKSRMHVQHRRDTTVNVMPFGQFRTNYFSMLADGEFEVDFPEVSYQPQTGCYGITLPMRRTPEIGLSFGGNISSTAFNEAYIGLNAESVGRVAQLGFAEVYVGPLYSMGRAGGRTTFFMKHPLTLDYSYNFSVLNSMKGYFGNVTDVDNTRKMRQAENYLSVGAGLPTGLKSMLSLTLNGGLNSYRYYETVDLNSGPTSRTRFLYVASQFKYERNTLDHKAYPRRGSRLVASASYVYGSDRYRRSRLYSDMSPQPSTAESRRSWSTAALQWEGYFDIPSCRWFSVGMNLHAVVSDHPSFTTGEATVVTSPQYAPTPHSMLIYVPEFHADKFVGAGIMPTFDIIPGMMVRAGVYALLRERRTEVEERMHYMSNLSLIYHTRLGPVSLSLTKYDFRSSRNMYLTLNFGYSIFGGKGLFN